MKLCVYGAGGQGREIVDLVRRIEKETPLYDEIFFADDVIGKKEYYNMRVFTFEEVKNFFKNDEIEFVVSLGDTENKELLYEKVKKAGYKFATIIDSSAKISCGAKIKEGVVLASAYISSDVEIGSGSLISEGAIIGHDVKIGKYCQISPGAFIGGYSNIGDNVFIGPMATIRDRITVGKSAVVAMGAAVYNDIPEGYTAIGNPARNMPNNR